MGSLFLFNHFKLPSFLKLIFHHIFPILLPVSFNPSLRDRLLLGAVEKVKIH